MDFNLLTSPELLLARIFDGLNAGAVYALVAVALVLIFKATTLINFAQGEMAMFGSFLAYIGWAEWGLPMWVAVAVAMILSALGAAAIERTLIRPFDPSDHLPLVIVTLGLLLIIGAVAGMIWRFDPRPFPELFPSGSAFRLGIANLRWYTVFTLASAVAMMALLQFLLSRTKIGLAFRAVSSNLESSELVGIRVGPTLQFGWALAAAAGTFGAVIFVADPVRQIEPSIMLSVLIFAAASAALGGLDSLWGALVGGLIVGQVQTLLVNLFTFIPNEMALAAAVFVLLVVLVLKPSGLFGTARVERV